MLVSKREYLFAGKLAALTLRKEVAMRDVYDIHYFGKNNWDINKEILKLLTGKDFGEYMTDCIATVESIKENRILSGLGELIDEKEKAWIKQHLKDEVVFHLQNYKNTLQSRKIP